MSKHFIVGVMDAYAYDVDTGDLLFVSKTLLDSSIETSMSNVDVRGGRGNPLLYSYWHSGNVQVQLNDAQWNLAFLAKALGSTVTTGNNVFTSETVTLGAGGAGTVVGTPLTVFGALYGWVTLADGETTEKVTFTNKDFTCTGAEGTDVTVRYYATNAASRSLTMRAEMIPSIVRLVLEGPLCSSDTSTNRIGTAQIEIHKFQLSPSVSISLKSDGVASTPLSGRALRNDATNSFVKITEIIDAAAWEDTAIALAITGGDFSLAAGATHTLVVRAIHSDGSVSLPPVADLDFVSSDETKASVSAAGLITGIAAGNSTIKVSIHDKNTIDSSIVVTVT
jgi:hypothetical protein